MKSNCFLVLVISVGLSISSAGAQTLEVLYAFQDSGGTWPQGVLVQDSDGTIYGTTHYGPRITSGNPGAGTVFKMTTNGALNTLREFAFDENGRYLRAGLARGSDGNFYGTTYRSSPVAAVLFRITPGGEFTKLAALDETTNGYFVNAALIQAGDGSFYGTATFGGTNSLGTVFKMATNGSVTTLVTFNGGNGSQPFARLLQARDGSFYGTTYAGGTSNLGTAFRLTTNGEFATLTSFTRTNGSRPYAGLVEDSDGFFYGTTSEGGANAAGTVFRLATNGLLTTLVHFGGTNGATPTAELIWGRDRKLYGTTWAGGAGGLGTAFQLTANGQLSLLAAFFGTNGSHPYAGLLEGADGHLYGAAQHGGPGTNDAGNVFRIVMPQIVAPSLNAKRSGMDVLLSWPTNASSFVLEWTTNLAHPIGWNAFSNSPASIGGEFVATNPISAGLKLYRLRKD